MSLQVVQKKSIIFSGFHKINLFLQLLKYLTICFSFSLVCKCKLPAVQWECHVAAVRCLLSNCCQMFGMKRLSNGICQTPAVKWLLSDWIDNWWLSHFSLQIWSFARMPERYTSHLITYDGEEIRQFRVGVCGLCLLYELIHRGTFGRQGSDCRANYVDLQVFYFQKPMFLTDPFFSIAVSTIQIAGQVT